MTPERLYGGGGKRRFEDPAREAGPLPLAVGPSGEPKH